MSLLDLINGLDPQNGRGFDDLNEMLARLRAAKPDESGNDSNAGYGMAVKDMPKPPTPDAQSWTPSLEPAQRMETTEPKNFTVPQTAPIVRPNPQAQPPMPQSGPTAMQPQAGQAPGNFALPKPTIAQHLMNIGAGFTGRGATDLNQQWETQNQLGRSLVDAGVAPNVVAAALQQPELMKQLVATKFGPKTAPTFAKIGTDQFGNDRYGFVDASKQTVTPYGTQTGGASGDMARPVDAQGKPLIGMDFLRSGSVPPMIADKAANIIAGREAMPTSVGRDKTALQVQEAVRLADPNYNGNRFKYRQAWENSNTTVGKTRVANNTAIGHANELANMIPDAPDTNAGVLSNIGNQAKTWWRTQTNDPWLKSWQANAGLLAGEIVKVATGSEGSIHDREQVLANLDPSNGKAALEKTLAKYIKLLASKTDALANDWKKNMGPYADQPQVIDDANQSVLDEMKKKFQVDKIDDNGTPIAAPLNLRGVPEQPPAGATTGPDGKITIANPNFKANEPESANNPRRLKWVP